MINSWKVQFLRGGKRVYKKFQGNSPRESGAVEFAKQLKLNGLSVDVISVRKPFPPPFKNKKKEWLGREEAPQHGLLWCPYCIKWREFHFVSIVMKDGIEGPELFRCPVCTVSTQDYWIKLFNPEMFERLEIAAQVKQDMKALTSRRRTANRTGTNRRRRVRRR